MEQIEETLDLIWLVFVITHTGHKCLFRLISSGGMTGESWFLFVPVLISAESRLDLYCKDQTDEFLCNEFKDHSVNQNMFDRP